AAVGPADLLPDADRHPRGAQARAREADAVGRAAAVLGERLAQRLAADGLAHRAARALFAVRARLQAVLAHVLRELRAGVAGHLAVGIRRAGSALRADVLRAHFRLRRGPRVEAGRAAPRHAAA